MESPKNIDPAKAEFTAMDTECATEVLNDFYASESPEDPNPLAEVSGFEVIGAEEGFSTQATSATGTIFSYQLSSFAPGRPPERIESYSCEGESPGCSDGRWLDIDLEDGRYKVGRPIEEQ